MKRIRLASVLAVLVLVMALSVSMVGAQGGTAYSTPFTTSITYQNVSGSAADTSITFFAQDGSQIAGPTGQLPANAGTSLFVGSLDNVTAGFRGAAVLSSNQPLVATLVQIPNGNPSVQNRPLSNGFTGEEGANRYLIPTTLKRTFGVTTIFSVQNVGSDPVNVTVNFYAVGSAVPAVPAVVRNNVAAGAATYFDLGDAASVAGLPDGFNGSAVVDASGPVVASAMELGSTGTAQDMTRAVAFEGVRQGSTTAYAATALCNVFGGQKTAYAVQNTSNAEITVTATYYGSNGAAVGNQAQTIPAGAKKSFVTCAGSGVTNGFSGSAVFNSSAANSIVAIGKKYVEGNILQTALSAVSAGSDTLALPYVRWATQENYIAGNNRGQRTNIAIQNLGGAAVGPVNVQYRDIDGNIQCTHTIESIGPNQKQNSSVGNNCPAEVAGFGYANGRFGGSVLVIGPDGSQLQAVATVDSLTGAGPVAEDYNGIPTAGQ